MLLLANVKKISNISIGHYRLSFPGIELCFRNGYSCMPTRRPCMRQPKGLAKGGLHTFNQDDLRARIVLGKKPCGIGWFGKIIASLCLPLGINKNACSPQKGA